MGTTFTIKNADFSANAVGYVPAVPEGLEYLNFFGVDAVRTARNLAPGKPPGVIAGSPVYGENSVTLTPKTNYIATSVHQTASMTVLLVIDPIVETPRSIIFGNADLSPVSNGFFLMLPATGAADGFADIRFTAAQNSGSGSTNINADLPNSLPVGALRAVVARMDESTRQRMLSIPSAGARAVNTGTAPVDIGPAPLLLGSYYHTSTFTAPFEIAAAAIYSRALSDAEIAVLYRSIASYYARRSISV